MTGRRGRSRRFLAGEALANLRAAPATTTVLALVGLVAGLSSTAFVITETAGIQQRWSSAVAAGRFVFTVPQTVPGGVTAARCDALNDVEGVVAAGSVIEQVTVLPANSPSTRVVLERVTAGYLRVIWPAGSDLGSGRPADVWSVPGVVVGADVADRLGLRPGVQLLVRSPRPVSAGRTGVAREVLPVATVVSRRAARDESASSRLYDVVPPQGPVDACLVEARPGAGTAVQELLFSWFPQDGQPVVRPFLADAPPIGRAPEAEFLHRVSRWAWTVPAALLALTHLGLWYARREELALYRLLGLRPLQVAVVVFVELIWTAVLPVQVGVAVAMSVLAEELAAPAVWHTVAAADARLMAALALLPLLPLRLVRQPDLLDRLKGE